MKRVLVPVGILLSVLLLSVGAVQARSGLSRSAQRQLGDALKAQSAQEEEGEAENESDEILTRAAQMSIPRTAPANEVSAAAFQAARAQAAQLPVRGGPWTEVTDIPYQNEDPRFRDPVWSNVGAGWFHVAGRITTLTTSGNAIFAGAADGGVWKSTDRGRHWHEWNRGLPRLSSGDLATNPRDGSVWYGLGESSTSFDSFEAEGVYRLARGARTWHRVGGNELLSNFVYRIRFDGAGHVYAATNRGLYRRNVGDLSSAWQLVLKPDPNPNNTPYRTSHITDVIIEAGSHGETVLAVLGWRGGTLESDERFNGFYVSDDSGQRGTFRRITPQGDIDAGDIGRTTLARAPSGRQLYAVIESPERLAQPDELEGFTNLQGVFMSPSGNPAGPWNEIADATELANSGSALAPFGLFPGIQTWYNQYVLVDPHNPRHVYVGLEEVFETRNAGRTWTTPGPYWNFSLPCYNGEIRSCPMTTHPDQHGMAIAWGRFFAGGDGGVYHRAVGRRGRGGWINTNRTLHTLQYYYAGIGRLPGGDTVWGGLQDNGVSLLLPQADHLVSPFGGDGGDTLVHPRDANKAVVEYVELAMAKTTNGGRTFTEISPSCSAVTYTPDPCDPIPRFIAPFRADVHNIRHWVAGGQFVWETRKGWNTNCSATACDWKIVHDNGEGHSTTALAVNGDTIYSAWCAPGSGCNPGQGAPFDSGIDTNYGGTWHRVTAPNLPNRYINNLAVDPADPAHVYAVYGAFSRRWIPGGGVGHVFESTNGGRTWTNITGNLPDIPADDIVLWKGKLVVATDLGVYVANRDTPRRWARLGRGFPNVATWDLTLPPHRRYVMAVTHGRGLWRISLP